MDPIRKFRIVAAIAAIIGGLHQMSIADEHIWFNDPHSNQPIYLQPGQSTVMVFWDISMVPVGPPLYHGEKTKVKIDNGGWMENVYEGWPVLGAGLHTFAAELWEYDVLGAEVHTGSDNISVWIVPQYNVTFKNSFTYGQVKVGNWNSRTLRNSPWTESVVQDSTRVAEAFDQNYQAPGEQNYFRVYQNWSKDDILFTSSNPMQTSPVTAAVTYQANFFKQFNVSLAAATFIESGSGGTYKVDGTNMGSNWNGSILQSHSKTLEAVAPDPSWVLTYWSDGVTDNPRVFTPVDHTTLSATFKKHLLSSESTVTGPSTQRKIVRDSLGIFHMVYESINRIWYCRSTDGGSTWSGEHPLADYYEGYVQRTPSITVQTSPHEIVAVWDTYKTDGSEHYIYYALIAPSTGQVISSDVITVDGGGMGNTYPCVGFGQTAYAETYAVIVWFDPAAGKLMAACRQTDGAFGSPTTLRTASIGAFSVAPVTANNGRSDYSWELVWAEGVKLHYAPILIGSSLSLSTTADSIIATGTEDGGFFSPSVACLYPYNGRPAVAWESWDGETYHVIKYRERSVTGGWGTVQVFGSSGTNKSNYYTPSLTGHYSGSDLSIAWRSSTSQLKYVQRKSGAWTAQTNLATGVDPNASLGWSPPGSEIVLYRGTSSPYAIQQSSVAYGQQMIAQDEPVAEGRGGTVITPNGLMSLAVLGASLDGVPIQFSSLNDTIPVVTQAKFDAALTSMQFPGSGTLQLKLHAYASTSLKSPGRFTVELLDQKTGRSLGSIATFGAPVDTDETVSVQLTFAGRQVVLALKSAGLAAISGYEVERWHLDKNSGDLAKCEGEAGASSTIRLLPSEYGLGQNYPNPFNPTTTIDYELPVDSKVRITIYDVLGRVVRELVNEVKEAGYHFVTLNVGNIASGPYFFRMVAEPAGGGDSYVAMKKLLVLK